MGLAYTGKNIQSTSEKQLDSYLLELALLRENNLITLELFRVFRYKLYAHKIRPFFNIFSILCWLISISTLLYLMLIHAF